MIENGLYIVSTPIGNLDDITLRALQVLKHVDLILCEDTRNTQHLLRHFGVKKTLKAYHQHNEQSLIPAIIERLQAGECIALVSDAGTPLINDPGWGLVHACRQVALPVYSIPGACAVVAALSVSGMPTDHFEFRGFMPHKASHREQELKTIANFMHTVVWYESPHRLMETLSICNANLPSRQCVLVKELTKVHEQCASGTANQLLEWLKVDPARQKGEFVFMIRSAEAVLSDEQVSISVTQLLEELTPLLGARQTSKIVAKWSGMRTNELYKRVSQE